MKKTKPITSVEKEIDDIFENAGKRGIHFCSFCEAPFKVLLKQALEQQKKEIWKRIEKWNENELCEISDDLGIQGWMKLKKIINN
jgi:hypothetical protein